MALTVPCEYESREGVACSVRDADPDDRCFGCGKVICGLHAEAPWGDHDAADHTECSVCGEAGHFDGECG